MKENILATNSIRRICTVVEDNVKGTVSFILDQEDDAYRIIIETPYFDWTEYIDISKLNDTSYEEENRIISKVLEEFKADIINEFFKIKQ